MRVFKWEFPRCRLHFLQLDMAPDKARDYSSQEMVSKREFSVGFQEEIFTVQVAVPSYLPHPCNCARVVTDVHALGMGANRLFRVPGFVPQLAGFGRAAVQI